MIKNNLKLLKLAVAVLSFFVITITNVQALTNDEEFSLNYFSNNYDSNYPYCIYSSAVSSNTHVSSLYCLSSIPNISCIDDGGNGKKCSISNYGSSYHQQTMNHYVNGTTVNSNNNTIRNYSSFNVSYINYSGYSSFNLYSNFNFIDSNNLVTSSSMNYGGPPQTYIITFIPPSGTTIEVKDSNNNTVQASSQYVYELEAGNYTYSASNSLYNNLTDVAFEVTDTATINVNMTSKIEGSNMRSIFSQYYTYISTLVSSAFNIENPLFLFIISFLIGFSLIYLIKKLIGGFF